MKIYHLQSEYKTGQHRIVVALYDNAVFSYDTSTISPHSIFEIDEIELINKDVCRDIVNVLNKVDINGDPKYYMLNNAGTWELHEEDGWEEYIDEVLL